MPIIFSPSTSLEWASSETRVSEQLARVQASGNHNMQRKSDVMISVSTTAYESGDVLFDCYLQPFTEQAGIVRISRSVSIVPEGKDRVELAMLGSGGMRSNII